MSSLPPKSTSLPRVPTQIADTGEFSREELVLLLQMADPAIEPALEGRDIPSTRPPPHLAEPRGVCASPYRHAQLRGCVGYVSPLLPVYRAVPETARAAASEDSRFTPVCHDEVPQLEVS